MSRVDLILLALIMMFASLSSGCAYYCWGAPTYYGQPSVTADTKFTQSGTRDAVYVDVAEGLSIGVSRCDAPQTVCVRILIDAGHRLVVPDPAVLSVQTQSGQVLGVGAYLRFPQNVTYAMTQTPIEFIGGVDPPRSDWERSLSKTRGWNEYRITFEVPRTAAADEIYVELPRMLLDTHAMPVPRFRLRRVIVEDCGIVFLPSQADTQATIHARLD
jgi:hypothetical protein